LRLSPVLFEPIPFDRHPSVRTDRLRLELVRAEERALAQIHAEVSAFRRMAADVEERTAKPEPAQPIE
jgi:hypothetical protein